MAKQPISSHALYISWQGFSARLSGMSLKSSVAIPFWGTLVLFLCQASSCIGGLEIVPKKPH